MSKASNINSLAALRERRHEIAAEQDAAKKGLTSTLAQAPAKAKEYALEDLALPALGIGLAVYIGYRMLRRQPDPAPVTERVMLQDTTPDSTYVAPTSAPRSAVQSRPQPVAAPRRSYVPQVEKSLFNLGTLMTAGKLLIPAAQAIIGVVQNQQTKQHIEENVE